MKPEQMFILMLVVFLAPNLNAKARLVFACLCGAVAADFVLFH